MRLPYRPRFINKMFAYLLGYFWLPCPLCGEDFGGHEWRVSLMRSTGEGKGVCPKCSERAGQINCDRGFTDWWECSQ